MVTYGSVGIFAIKSLEFLLIIFYQCEDLLLVLFGFYCIYADSYLLLESCVGFCCVPLLGCVYCFIIGRFCFIIFIILLLF